MIPGINITRMHYCTSLILTMLWSVLSAGAQEDKKDYNTREVIVSKGDTLIKAKIMLAKVKPKADISVEYYWFYQNNINHNVGDFAGNLLHGEYLVFNKSHHLVEKGNFEQGVKDGRWKRWHANGELLSNIIYKDGFLEGESRFYGADGKPEKILQYKSGILHGVQQYYAGDSVMVKKYEKGTEIKPKEKSQKVRGEENFLMKWFKKIKSPDEAKHDKEPKVKTPGEKKKPAMKEPEQTKKEKPEKQVKPKKDKEKSGKEHEEEIK